MASTDGASVWARVCVLCFLWRQTHNLKRGPCARTLPREQGDTNPHLRTSSGFEKQPRSHGYNSSSSASSLWCFVAATACVHMYVCSVHEETFIHALKKNHDSHLYRYLFPRTHSFLTQTQVVEPHPAKQQYTRYTAILGVNWDV